MEANANKSDQFSKWKQKFTWYSRISMKHYKCIIWGSMLSGTKELTSAIILKVIEHPYNFRNSSIPISRPYITRKGECIT